MGLFGGLFGGSTDTQYKQSQEQRDVYQALQPLLRGLSTYGMGNLGMPGLGIPQAPYMPSMQGVLSGISNQYLMPSQGWYQNLSPEVMSGVWEPYNEGARQMLEVMGGNPRAGYSGATGAALGKYYENAATDIGRQAWEMTQPAYQAQYTNLLQERSSDYQQELARRNADYQAAMRAWEMPFSALGLMGGTYSTPIVTQQPGLLDVMSSIGSFALPWALLL